MTHDDSAHGSSSEPLLQQSENPKHEDPQGKRFSMRSFSSMHEYFTAKSHAPTPGYMLFLALVFGVSSGVVAFIYDTYFEAILKLVWEVRPRGSNDHSQCHLNNISDEMQR